SVRLARSGLLRARTLLHITPKTYKLFSHIQHKFLHLYHGLRELFLGDRLSLLIRPIPFTTRYSGLVYKYTLSKERIEYCCRQKTPTTRCVKENWRKTRKHFGECVPCQAH